MKHNYKLGRQPRAFDTKIVQLSALLAKHPHTAPATVDWSNGILDFGVMLNDKLGCCTSSAVYHAHQIWTANVTTEATESDGCVLALYEQTCGYDPKDPKNTDLGGNEQDVLKYLLKPGFPKTDGTYERILSFVEVNHRSIEEVKVAISEFGLVYIGFEVPSSVFGLFDGLPNPIWNVNIFRSRVVGGHAVVLVGYDDFGPTCVSWGKTYKMSWKFFMRQTDEVYAIVSTDWINTKGKTPLGLTITELSALASDLEV